MNLLLLSEISAVQIIIEIIVFLALTLIGIFIVKTYSKSENRFLNLEEFIPKDEIHTLTQVSTCY